MYWHQVHESGAPADVPMIQTGGTNHGAYRYGYQNSVNVLNKEWLRQSCTLPAIKYNMGDGLYFIILLLL